MRVFEIATPLLDRCSAVVKFKKIGAAVERLVNKYINCERGSLNKNNCGSYRRRK